MNEYNDAVGKSFAKFEIQIRYNNGDNTKGEFKDKVIATNFLRTLPSVIA